MGRTSDDYFQGGQDMESKLLPEIERLTTEVSQLELALVAAMSTVVHLEEHIDTGEPLDLEAAQSSRASPALQQWVKDNAVMLPVKR